MIRFRNAMGYYDIHTHQMPFHKEDIAIYKLDRESNG